MDTWEERKFLLGSGKPAHRFIIYILVSHMVKEPISSKISRKIVLSGKNPWDPCQKKI